MNYRYAVLLIFILLLTACQTVLEEDRPLSTTPESQIPAAQSQTQPAQKDPLLPVIIEKASQPLKITFPTPLPEKVSIWRPPLYDVPFALGPHDHFYFIRPIAVNEVNWPLADYRYGDFFPGRDIIHTGIDIDAPLGSPVLAVGPGRVIWAGYGFSQGIEDLNDPYGQAVAIKHDFGYNGRQLTTVYGHLDRVDVVPGQRVQAGDVIGAVGNTGHSTGPHLHLEVRIEDTKRFFSTRNPELWLAPPVGWGVLAGRAFKTDGNPIIGQVITAKNIETGKRYSARTYAGSVVVSDDYYRENFVIADLPSGQYEVTIDYEENRYTTLVEIHPGAISFLVFQGEKGFRFEPPVKYNPKLWLGNN